jgi:hypothetical protein
MLTDIPVANIYYLNPLKEINSTKNRMFTRDKVMEVGGVGVMDEIGKLIDDKQLVLVMGVSDDRCLIFVDINDVECADIIARAKQAFDGSLKSIE